MSSRPRRYTSNGGFGKTHFSDDEGDDEPESGDLDIDFSITESGRTVAHLIANMKDQQQADDNMDFSITDSGGRSLDDTTPAPAAAHIDFSISKSGRSIAPSVPSSSNSSVRSTRSTRSSNTKAIPVAPVPSLLGPMDQDQPAGKQHQQAQGQSGSYESSGSAFVSGLMSHTPPADASYETRHFGKRARAGSVSGRLRSASDLEDKGIIDRKQKGILKDLIICGDEQLQEALDKYEKGDKSQLEGMIKSGALSQKLPADMDLLGELDLDFLTVDDVTIGSMGHQNVEQSSLPNNTRSSKSLPHISFPSSSSVGGQSDDGIGELDLHDFAGNDSDSYLRYNSRSNSIDLDNFRSRSNSVVDGRDRSNSLALSVLQNEGRDRSNSLAYGASQNEGRDRSNSLAFSVLQNEGRDRSNSLAYGVLQNEGRDRSNSLAYGILQNEPSADAAAAHQRWMDRAVPGKEPISLRRGPNAPVAVSGIGASLAEYQNRVTAKPTKAQLAEEKKKERQLKKEVKEREKLEQKERKEQERREKREQKERDKIERKGKKTQKAKLKEEEAEEEEKIVQSGTGRPRSMSDPNISSTIDANGLLQVDRPEGWVGAYSPESRTIRIERFMEKRKHRVWTKSVKYDVRKNFADSRLRVKGRFVKKEDELLMRELMSLT